MFSQSVQSSSEVDQRKFVFVTFVNMTISFASVHVHEHDDDDCTSEVGLSFKLFVRIPYSPFFDFDIWEEGVAAVPTS